MAMTARFERFDVRMALNGATAVFYALTFGPLYEELGPGVVSLSVVPVALAGWLFGLRAGLLAGAVAAVSIAIGAVVLTQDGSDGAEHHPAMWIARVATAAGALLTGLLGDSLSSLALMAILLALVVGQLLVGAYLRAGGPASEVVSGD